MRVFQAFVAVASSTATVACTAEDVPDNQMISLCIQQKDWPALIERMERFARTNNLKLIGGVEPDAEGKPSLNVAVAQGYNYYFGDDLDLWITSNPFRSNVISYGAVGQKNPINHEQWELTRRLLREIQPPASPAHGTRQEPSCPQIETIQTPR